MSASQERPLAVVTGGAGFIGSHAVDQLLAKGYRVHVIDDLTGGRIDNLAEAGRSQDFRFEQQDITTLDPESAVFKGAKIVLHFAGIGDIVPSIEPPIDYMAVNVQGTVRVLEAARQSNAKLVYAASSTCYGLASTPTREDHPIDPQFPYALSKWMGERACFHWLKVYGAPMNVIRIFNAYGTRSRTSGAYGAVFGVFLKQKLAGAPFTVVGDGAQSRDFVYVTDVAKAFVAAAETPIIGQAWNVGAGAPQTVNRLVELLGGPHVNLPTRPGEPACTWADTTAIRRDLGWEPSVSFERGVAMILENIDYWRDAPLWTPESIREATQSWFKHLTQTKPS
jgi:UDP-glucose 4-epimerase